MLGTMLAGREKLEIVLFVPAEPSQFRSDIFKQTPLP